MTWPVWDGLHIAPTLSGSENRVPSGCSDTVPHTHTRTRTHTHTHTHTQRRVRVTERERARERESERERERGYLPRHASGRAGGPQQLQRYSTDVGVPVQTERQRETEWQREAEGESRKEGKEVGRERDRVGPKCQGSFAFEMEVCTSPLCPVTLPSM